MVRDYRDNRFLLELVPAATGSTVFMELAVYDPPPKNFFNKLRAVRAFEAARRPQENFHEVRAHSFFSYGIEVSDSIPMEGFLRFSINQTAGNEKFLRNSYPSLFLRFTVVPKGA
jgi:hypothetical protein